MAKYECPQCYSENLLLDNSMGPMECTCKACGHIFYEEDDEEPRDKPVKKTSEFRNDIHAKCHPYDKVKFKTFQDRVVIVVADDQECGSAVGLTPDAAVVLAAELLRWARVYISKNPSRPSRKKTR